VFMTARAHSRSFSDRRRHPEPGLRRRAMPQREQVLAGTGRARYSVSSTTTGCPRQSDSCASQSVTVCVEAMQNLGALAGARLPGAIKKSDSFGIGVLSAQRGFARGRARTTSVDVLRETEAVIPAPGSPD
jgi:hypothetical protein